MVEGTKNIELSTDFTSIINVYKYLKYLKDTILSAQKWIYCFKFELELTLKPE